MADNVTLPATGEVVATDEIGGVDYQRIKVTWGPDGTANDTDIATGKPFPIQTRSSTGLLTDGLSVIATITRPANTTAYAANDVLGGAITFAAIAPAACQLLITSVQLEADIAAIASGMTTFRLALYNVTPPSAIADNAAFDVASGDRASFLGIFSLGAPADLGATLYCEVNGVNKQVTTSGTALYGYLVTNGAFTPAGNSEVYKVTLHAMPVY